jgi:lipopolysaccharide export system permease protein
LRILDRYVFRQVFITCLGAVGFFTFILLTAKVLRELLAFMLTGQLTFATAVPLVGLLIPFVVVYTLPMGLLCGILLVLGRLSAESETVAMRAAGQSLARICRPIYVLAAVATVGAIAINLYYMPVAITKQRQEFAQAVRGDPLKIIVPKTFVRDFRNMIVYVNEKNGGELRDIWIYQLDREQRVTRFLRAERGHLDLDEANNQLVVTLFNVAGENRSAKDPENFKAPLQPLSFETTTQKLSLDYIFGQQTFRRKIDWLTWHELKSEEARLEKPVPNLSDSERVKQLIKVRFSMQEKLSTAFSVISFALIAVPLGITVSRRETSANLGVALALALAYYFLTIAAEWMDHFPNIRPELFLWVPNIIFVAGAVWLHRRAERVS